MSIELKAINQMILAEEFRVQQIYAKLTENEKNELLKRHLMKKIVFFDNENKSEQEKVCIISEIGVLNQLFTIREYIINNM